MSENRSHDSVPVSDPHRGVVLVLLGAAVLGMLVAVGGGWALGRLVALDAALGLWLAAGVLLGVARAQTARRSPVGSARSGAAALWGRLPDLRSIRTFTAGVGIMGTGSLLFAGISAEEPLATSAVAAACVIALAAAGLAATAARYLAGVDFAQFPEAPGLCRAARVLAWLLGLVGFALILDWAGSISAVRIAHLIALILVGVVCYQLSRADRPTAGAGASRFPTDLQVFSLLGSRVNPLASVLDMARRELGIDLRSTWALTLVRHSAEPLLVGFCAIAWLSTALTVIGLEEQGLVERLGVTQAGPPLAPGVHLHFPWPIDRVIRFPVRRVQFLAVGHEGETGAGPEDVLWARQHGGTEYTLLLGDGRDLIAIDASVQFRIVDPRAWRYGSVNPAGALRAIAYREVMKATVGRTLAEALSENVAILTTQMRAMVQADSDALGLGVEVVGFTLGGMHPPTRVAEDYQAVVSAELRKKTAAIDAQAYHNRIVPMAEAEVTVRANAARASGAEAFGKAAGEAWSFRALESEYRAAPLEYRFRRRLETLENTLGGRSFTVLDARIQRDGGELWLMK
jgi:membrane protease subunit HflK